MGEGKILIVNLSKSVIGEDNAVLLGAMLVTQMQLAALSRADIAENKRRSFYLYVDKVHNFLTQSFTSILSESRKYGLHLILAHQYASQLQEEIRDAVFGNVGTIISFGVGPDDAHFLAKEFAPIFDEMDFVNLPHHHIYLKLMIDGVTSRPFSAVTLPLPTNGISNKDEIIKESRRRYGRPRKEVEQKILLRSANNSPDTARQRRLL